MVTPDSHDNVAAPVLRWQLADRMRQLRETSGLTIERAADGLRKTPGSWSKSKLSRIERREQRIKPREMEQLLDVYRVTDDDVRAELMDLAEKATERGWWLAYRGGFREQTYSFVGLESSMIALRQFETLLVPGLLQTADYARALRSGMSPSLSRVDVERRVAARMARQQILVQDNPPHLHVILSHCVLEQQVGHPSIMRAQLRQLAETAEFPNVTLQVLPRLHVAHVGMEGPFSILSLPDPVPDVGYTEGPGGNLYVEDRDRVRECTLRFGTLIQMALSADESIRLIAETAQ